MHSLYATGPDPYDKLRYKPGECVLGGIMEELKILKLTIKVW